MRGNLFATVFFIILACSSNARALTGEVISGEATSFGVRVVIQGSPILTIFSPKNSTYFGNDSLKVEISTSGQSAWFQIDSGPYQNINIGYPAYFNTTEGGHMIFIYSSSGGGYETTVENISFSVDSTLYSVRYSEFKGAYRGDSSNFNEYLLDEIQTLNGVVFENTLYGKIELNGTINVTDDGTNDNVTDIDKGVNISFGRIELNSSILPNFNKPAKIQFYNLNYTTLRVLRDGATCPPNICQTNIYANGTLSVNVSGFSVYSIEDTTPAVTPSSNPPSEGGASGGGGAAAPSACKPDWKCIDWENCKNAKRALISGELSGDNYRQVLKDCESSGFKGEFCGYHTRICSDSSGCNLSREKPALMESCYYTENPSCEDGIKNCHDGSCEFLVDCGGPCSACATCEDGIQNQGEIGIDCGGPCPRQCTIQEKLENQKFPVLFLIIGIFLIFFVLILYKFIRKKRRNFRKTDLSKLVKFHEKKGER